MKLQASDILFFQQRNTCILEKYFFLIVHRMPEKISFIFIVDTYFFFLYYCSRQQIYFFFLTLFKVVIFISISHWCCSHWSYVSMTIYFIWIFSFFYLLLFYIWKILFIFFSLSCWYDWPRNWWHNYSFSSLSLNLNLCCFVYLFSVMTMQMQIKFNTYTKHLIQLNLFFSLTLDFMSFHLNICWRHQVKKFFISHVSLVFFRVSQY